MKIARSVLFEDGKVIFRGMAEEKILEILLKEFANAYLDSENLIIPANSLEDARDVYVKLVNAIRLTPHIVKLGFNYREVFGYGFLVYLSEYRDGMEREILDNPLSGSYDIVTLPNRDGYYYSTLYGIDNVNLPAMLVVGNLYARELLEIVEANPSIVDLLDLKRVSENLLRLERFGETKLINLAKYMEKIERIEEIVRKMLAVRFAFSCDFAIAGNVEHKEVQKIRRLGNGLCVYLSKSLRDKVGIKEGDAVSVRVISNKIFIEKV